MANKEWKIFKIVGSETEWVCARTNIEALQCLCSNTDMSLYELGETVEVIEAPKEDWDKEFVIMDIDGDEEDQEKSKITFTQWMRDHHDGKHPAYIASTCF